MEHIMEVKISVKIETNKATYEKEFVEMEEAQKWFDEQMENLEN